MNQMTQEEKAEHKSELEYYQTDKYDAVKNLSDEELMRELKKEEMLYFERQDDMEDRGMEQW